MKKPKRKKLVPTLDTDFWGNIPKRTAKKKQTKSLKKSPRVFLGDVPPSNDL